MTAATPERFDDLPARESARLMESALRRRIMSTLAGVDRADFSFVRDAVEVSGSVLSRHVAMLVHAGYVTTSRGTIARRRGVWLSLTSRGSRALQEHLAATHHHPGRPGVAAAAQPVVCSSPAT